jgi:hypothetical protein
VDGQMAKYVKGPVVDCYVAVLPSAYSQAFRHPHNTIDLPKPPIVAGARNFSEGEKERP